VHAAVLLCRTATRWDSDLRALPITTSAYDEGQTSCTPADSESDSASAAADAAAAAAEAAVFRLRMREAVLLARQCVMLGMTPSTLHFLTPASRLDPPSLQHAASQQHGAPAESTMPPCDAMVDEGLRPLAVGAAQPGPGHATPNSMVQSDALLGAVGVTHVSARGGEMWRASAEATPEATPDSRQQHRTVIARGAQPAADEHMPPPLAQAQAPPSRLSRAGGRPRGAQNRAEPGGLSQSIDSRAEKPQAQRPLSAAQQAETRPPAGNGIGRGFSGASAGCTVAQCARGTNNVTTDVAPEQQPNMRPGSTASSSCQSDDDSVGGSWAANVHVTVKIPPCYGSPYPSAAGVVRSTDAAMPCEPLCRSDRLAVSARRQASVGTQAGGARPADGGGPEAPLRRWLTQSAAVADQSDGAAALSVKQGRLILDGLNAVLLRLTSNADLACAADPLTAAPARPRSDARQLRQRVAITPTAADVRQGRPAAAMACRLRESQALLRPGSATPSAHIHRTTTLLRPKSKGAAHERPHVLSPTVSPRRSHQGAARTPHNFHAATRCVLHD